MRHEIYIIQNEINGKVYVGKTHLTTLARFKQHKWDMKKKSCTRLYNSFYFHGLENFSVLPIDEALSVEEANRLERLYIDIFRSSEPDFGYNLTLGGDGAIPNEETREKLRQISLDMWRNPEFRIRMGLSPEPVIKIPVDRSITQQGKGNPFFGKHHKPEAKEIMSKKKKEAFLGTGNPFFGKRHSEETKSIMKEYHNSHKLFGIENNNFDHSVSNDDIKREYELCRNTAEVGRRLGIGQVFVHRRCKAMGLLTPKQRHEPKLVR